MRKLYFLMILTCVVLLAGCESTQSKIDKLETQKQESQARLDAVKQRISTLQAQSNKLVRDLQANHNQTMTLIRDNPGTVACIASGVIIVGDENTFSKDLKEFGTLVGLGCIAVYLFDEDFQKSADDFVAKIEQASNLEKKLQADINALKPKVEEETRQWKSEKVVYDDLAAQIQKLQSEL